MRGPSDTINPVTANRHARLQRRLANIIQTIRIRSEDEQRSIDHGRSINAGLETQVDRLEQLIDKLEQTLGL